MYKKRKPGVPPNCSAQEKAYRLLEKYDYSEKGLFDKLRQLCYSEEDAAAAVAVCVKRNFVNDRRYGEVLCRRYGEKYGERRVLTAMCAKGIPTELAKELIAAAKEEKTEDEDEARIIALLKRKLRGEPLTGENRQKISAFLARKGYSSSQIWAAMKIFDENYDSITEETGYYDE